MKNLPHRLILVIVFGLAIYLRTTNLLGRLDYGWDQARDLSVLTTILETGSLPLLGPVVRGEIGGFHLAPYYYYLLFPFYLTTGSTLISLALFSILVDLAVILLLFLFLRSRLSVPSSLVICGLWAASTLTVGNSLTPWNVSLIPLWTILTLWLLDSSKLSLSRRVITLLVLGLSTSIHLTLIPVAAVLAASNFRRLLPRKLSELGIYLFAILLPQLPLIIFDLTHNLNNLRAIHRFYLISRQTTPQAGFWPALTTKLDLTFSRLFLSHPYQGLGLFFLGVSILFPLLSRRKQPAHLNALIIIGVTILSLVIYRDPQFAEYYLNPALVPVIVLVVAFFSRLHRYLPIVLLTIGLFLSRANFDSTTRHYSLLKKKELVTALSDYTRQAEVRVDVAEGRGLGLAQYLTQTSFDNNPEHPLKAIITDSSIVTYPAPEEARSVVYEQVIGGLKLIVFSN